MDERVRRTVETYETNADAYAERNADREAVEAVTEEFLDSVGDGRVLDLGCGPGWETGAFEQAGLDAVGVDLASALLADAADRTQAASFVRGDARNLPLDADAFDGVWACASLLHVPRADLPDAIDELARVLVPGGVLTATVKSDEYHRRSEHPDSGSDHYDGDRHFEYYAVGTFRERVEGSGFTVVECTHTDDGWIVVHARAP